jgi:1,4-dihydroxy-2-naphthoyl-CoA synthase
VRTNKFKAILINSNSPKAFCAGGDIRFLYDSYQNGTPIISAIFADEYHMLKSLRQYAKPVMVFLDGYVLVVVLVWHKLARLLLAVKNHVLPCQKPRLVFSQMSAQPIFCLV